MDLEMSLPKSSEKTEEIYDESKPSLTLDQTGVREKGPDKRSRETTELPSSRQSFEVVDVLIPHSAKRRFLNAMVVRTSQETFLVGPNIRQFMGFPYDLSDPDVVHLTSEHENNACVAAGGDGLMLVLKLLSPSAAAIRPLVQLKHTFEQHGRDHCSEYEHVLVRLIQLSQRFSGVGRDAFFESFESLFGCCFFFSPTSTKMLLSKPICQLVDEYLELRHLGRPDDLQLGLMEALLFQDYMSAVRWWLRGENIQADNEEFFHFNLGQVLSKFPILPASTIKTRYKEAFTLDRGLELLMLTQPRVLINAEDWRVIRQSQGECSV